MPWKTQEIEVDGNKVSTVLVDQAGNPIWVDEKGMEIGQDVVHLRSQISAANKEAGGYRIKIKEMEDAAKLFEGLEPEAARKALDMVANLKDKEILDAGKIEEIKAKAISESNTAWERKFGNAETAYTAKTSELEAKVAGQDKVIRNLMVRGSFEQSVFIKEQVADNYFPEVLYTMFGPSFEVRPSDNGGDPVVVAKNAAGEEIMSPANPRQFATPEEAIEILIRSHPMSKHILKGSQASGSGALGGGGGGGSATPLQKLKDQYAAAKKANNVTAMVALKNVIFKEDPTFAG